MTPRNKQTQQETANKFSDQYRTKEWKQRREEIVLIDNGECRRCGSIKNLNVHHLLYKPNVEVWDYSDTELVTLCESCHLEIHHYKTEINKHLVKLMSDWCFGMNNHCDYENALMIIKNLSELSNAESKKYAAICINVGTIIGGSCE